MRGKKRMVVDNVCLFARYGGMGAMLMWSVSRSNRVGTAVCCSESALESSAAVVMVVCDDRG